MSEGYGNGARRRASAGVFAALHALLLAYSLSGIFSKLIVWGLLFFHEQVTANMVVGATIVMAGVILYSTDRGEKDGEAK